MSGNSEKKDPPEQLPKALTIEDIGAWLTENALLISIIVLIIILIIIVVWRTRRHSRRRYLYY